MPGIARQSHMQQTHFLRRTINYNDAGVASGLLVGTVPAGAVLGNCRVYVQTVFNAGTTNTLNVGTTGTGGEVIGTAQAAPTATGRKLGTAIDSIGTPFAADQDIFASYVQTGTVATTGIATVVIEYIPNNDK